MAQIRHAVSSQQLLLRAIYGDDHDALESLLKNGADLNACDPETKWAPLTYAIERDNKWVAEWLLGKGANPNYSDLMGYTPLLYAIDKNKEWAVTLLIGKGADPNFLSPSGVTPLLYAIQQDKEWAAKLLLKNGASPTRAGGTGQTTPMIMALNTKREWAEKLLLGKDTAQPTPFTAESRAQDGGLDDLVQVELSKGNTDTDGISELFWSKLLTLFFGKLDNFTEEGWVCVSQMSDIEDLLIRSFNAFLASLGHETWVEALHYADPIPCKWMDRTSLFGLGFSEIRHRVALGFYKDYVVFGNRGGAAIANKRAHGLVFGVSILRVATNQWDKLGASLKNIHSVEDWYSLMKSPLLLPVQVLSLPAQRNGNCTLASPEAAIFGLIWIQAIERGLAAKEITDFWVQWGTWSRQYIIKTYFNQKRVQQILACGLDASTLEGVNRSLAASQTPQQLLAVLQTMQQKISAVDRNNFYRGMEIEVTQGHWGSSKDFSQYRTAVDRNLDALSQLADKFQESIAGGFFN